MNKIILSQYLKFILSIVFIQCLVISQGLTKIDTDLITQNLIQQNNSLSSQSIAIDQESRLQRFRSEISEVLKNSQSQVLAKQKNNSYWLYPMYLGSMYTSQYILIRSIIEKKSKIKLVNSTIDLNYYKNHLAETQNKEDGSWQLIEDVNNKHGDLNATIMHYVTLKYLENHTINLEKSREFILKNGGIEKASLFTKIILALIGNYSWDRIPRIPYILFSEIFPMNYKSFGQWIGPHLLPISYLKHRKVHHSIKANFDLSDLFLTTNLKLTSNQNPLIPLTQSQNGPQLSDIKIAKKILASQKPAGSFGGYTTATLFSMLALLDYQDYHHDLDSQLNRAIRLGLEFVDRLYFSTSESSITESAYLGVTCDGRYWDTALIAQGLLESGVSRQRLNNVVQFILEAQDKTSGGFGFGIDFETFMDTDDTAEILILFHQMGIKSNQTQKAIDWLLKMQNDGRNDGGWGAFSKNNNGNFILDFATRSFLDSADMFDESSPDVTGHILEALSLYGLNYKSSPAVKRAVDYLLKHSMSKEIPAWSGRWGSNYIYGTSASLIGLISVGIKPKESIEIKNSIAWLKKCQNEDGGFGESFGSYSDIKLACKGISTPSQTAWALMALIKAGEVHSIEAKKSVQFLIQNYNQNKQWTDGKTFVGTGHPKIVPMHYPSYAWVFPMIALSRYLKATEGFIN